MTKNELDVLLASKVEEVKKGFRTEPVTDATAANLELSHTILNKSDKPEVRKFQEQSDDLYLVDKILKSKEGYTGIKSLKLFKNLQNSRTSDLAKALTAGGSNAGADWIPTGYSAQLQTMIDQNLVVAPLFPSFNLPQNPYIFPVATSHATAYKIAEMGEVTASTPATDKITFTALKLATQVQASYEMEEESIIAVLPFIKEELAQSVARGIDNALVNGAADSSIDADNTTASDQRRMFSGLRKLAIANAYTTDLSTFNSDTINLDRKKLGKYGVDPSKCAYLVSNSVAIQLAGLKDASGNAVVLTMDKLGPQATIKNGLLGTLYGAPVYTTEFLKENLNASGIYDATVTTYTGMIYLRPDAFKFATYGPVITESFRVIDYQYTKLVTSKMIAFNPMFAIASNHILNYGIKITA